MGIIPAAQLAAWLRRHNLRLAPRALTLTMYFRVLLADQFVHGIGGGRYDHRAHRAGMLVMRENVNAR